MGKNTSVVLTDQQEAFVRTQIEQGRFASVSEAVRAGLSTLQERDQMLDALRREIDVGDASGPATPLDIDAFLADLRG
ncbi:type II toxin-antitoxin system ParD family antitoxin [Hoeflea sp. G2-23]|uniref:Type II toxin-antitoxin system ParD family antitoxin n=1 Tax=Hoeflea algicola TaxID=2983763 RepID=A0ABT3Z6B1_9HYPH|nr:type II toxin-antitoxin system ParD family antitoxin [Hoeflea algicola]MCY0147309.1 type II toxin-antitoxin system ParD family antitoxin [Hoeflea algicola]